MANRLHRSNHLSWFAHMGAVYLFHDLYGYLMEMSDNGRDQIEPLLFQRGGGYFDADGNCILDNETAVKTMAWYIPLVAGPHKIGNNLGGGQVLTQAVESEYLLCLVAPDWRTRGQRPV